MILFQYSFQLKKTVSKKIAYKNKLIDKSIEKEEVAENVNLENIQADR